MNTIKTQRQQVLLRYNKRSEWKLCRETFEEPLSEKCCMFQLALVWIRRTHLWNKRRERHRQQNRENNDVRSRNMCRLISFHGSKYRFLPANLRCRGRSTGARWACWTLRESSEAPETDTTVDCCSRPGWDDREEDKTCEGTKCYQLVS